MQAKGYMFDLEGTLVKGKEFCPLPGALRVVETCRPNLVVTNNTTHTPNELFSALREAGFRLEPEQILTPLTVLPAYVSQRAWRRLLPIGSEQLRRLLCEHGFDVTDAPSVDAVIVGLDTSITYDRLRTATRALMQGAALLALHRNRLFLDTDGSSSPSAGATIAYLTYATGVRARLVGKPSRSFFRTALRRLGMLARDCVVVGDDPFAEVAGAKAVGMKAVFVLTGKYRSPTILSRVAASRRPDLVIRSLEKLPCGGQPDR